MACRAQTDVDRVELTELFQPRPDETCILKERWSNQLAERFYAAAALYRHRYGDHYSGALDSFWSLPPVARRTCFQEPLLGHCLHLVLKALAGQGEDQSAWRRAMRLLSVLMLGSHLRDGGFPFEGRLQLRADRTGTLTFPNWSGAVRLERRPPRGWVHARMRDGRLRLTDGRRREIGFQLAQAPPLPLLLDEAFGVHVTHHAWYRAVGWTVIDRYRPEVVTVDGEVPADQGARPQRPFPLTTETVERLERALSLLVDCAPRWAADLRHHGQVVVPIATTCASGFSVTTCRGTVFITAEEDPVDTLDHYVHEASHNKLDTFTDLVPLADHMPGRRFPSPWREDPRPIDGLIHGAYVFSAVAHVLREVAERRPHLRAALASRVRAYLAQVTEAVETIRAEASLTEAGRAFLDGLQSWNRELQ